MAVVEAVALVLIAAALIGHLIRNGVKR